MASFMVTGRARVEPPPMSVPRPIWAPSRRKRAAGAMPEAIFILEPGQWAI